MEQPSTDENVRMQVVGFCPGCFASEDDGSWGCVVVGDFCANCGAMGTVQLPRWAIESIRKQASWVGKRYYPCDEDREDRRELRYLRMRMDQFAPPIEVVTIDLDGKVRYSARRGNTTVSSYDTPEEAKTLGARSLRHPVPDDFEPVKNPIGERS